MQVCRVRAACVVGVCGQRASTELGALKLPELKFSYEGGEDGVTGTSSGARRDERSAGSVQCEPCTRMGP